MVFDKHLSPNQVHGVWESNEAARTIIEHSFGPGALAEAEDHLKSAQGVTNSSRDRHPRPADASHNATASRKGSWQDQLSELDRTLALEINPTWGVQKIFQHYRAALNALNDESARSKPTIARFRQANIGVEQLLRIKLPNRLRSIDAIYQSAGLEP